MADSLTNDYDMFTQMVEDPTAPTVPLPTEASGTEPPTDLINTTTEPPTTTEEVRIMTAPIEPLNTTEPFTTEPLTTTEDAVETVTTPTVATIEPPTGMKRPRRAAATTAMERMQEVLAWERCTESSKLFKDAALQINEEFDRASKGERSYRKKPAAAATGEGGVAAPDPPSDDERNETKGNDEAEEDSVDGSSDSEEGSFVVSDEHLSQGETGDERSGSEGDDDKSSLTCSDNSGEEEHDAMVDDTESIDGDPVESQPESISETTTAPETEAITGPGLETELVEENSVGPVLEQEAFEPMLEDPLVLQTDPDGPAFEDPLAIESDLTGPIEAPTFGLEDSVWFT